MATEYNNSSEKNQSYTYIDVLRFIGIIAVIAIHTDLGELYIDMPLGSVSYYVCMFISMFVSFSPVVFFMISGALLLGKNESIKDLWMKRVLRMVIVLILISLLYMLFDLLYDVEKADAVRFLPKLYSEARIIPLWYLYAYIAFLITLPFIRGIASVINEKSGLYFFALAVFLKNIIPLIENIAGGSYHLQGDLRWDWMMNTVILYPIIGYWIHTKVSIEKIKKWLWLAVIIDVVYLMYYTYFVCNDNISKGVNAISDAWRGKISLINAVTVFMLLRVICKKTKSEKSHRLWKQIGECVFGTYLIHGVFIGRIKVIGTIKDYFFGLFEGAFLIIPAVVWVFVIFILGYICTHLARKLPVLKSLI